MQRTAPISCRFMNWVTSRPSRIRDEAHRWHKSEKYHGYRRGDLAMMKKFPRNKLIQAFQQLCTAVSFAHSQGVVHRAKPSNVMGDFGGVLLLDWGLCKIMGAGAGQHAQPVIAGRRYRANYRDWRTWPLSRRRQLTK